MKAFAKLRLVAAGLATAVVVASFADAASAATAGRVKRSPHGLTADRVAVTLRFLKPNNSVDYRYSVLPGTKYAVGVVAEAYNAENQLIVGPLQNPLNLAFLGSALTVAPSTMTFGVSRLLIEYDGTTDPSTWGMLEERGGSTPVPYDVLTTGLAGCTAPFPTQGANTEGCLTVAPLIITPGGMLGPNLNAPLDVAGQFGGAALSVAEGQDLPISLFEARTGSAYEPEVADTIFSFSNASLYGHGECTPQFGPPSAAGAWKYWILHGYFFASPAIWYWNSNTTNCAGYYPPSGLSLSLDIGPNGGALPYGANIHGDSTFGRPFLKAALILTDSRVYRVMLVTVTK
jgi:hypothetical protein